MPPAVVTNPASDEASVVAPGPPPGQGPPGPPMQVIYPVPAYTGIVVLNPPEHPDYARRNPNSQGSKGAPVVTAPAPLPAGGANKPGPTTPSPTTSTPPVRSVPRDLPRVIPPAPHPGPVATPERPSPVPVPVGRELPRAPKPEVKPESKPEAKPAAKAEAKPEAKPDTTQVKK